MKTFNRNEYNIHSERIFIPNGYLNSVIVSTLERSAFNATINAQDNRLISLQLFVNFSAPTPIWCDPSPNPHHYLTFSKSEMNWKWKYSFHLELPSWTRSQIDIHSFFVVVIFYGSVRFCSTFALPLAYKMIDLDAKLMAKEAQNVPALADKSVNNFEFCC